jgi:hypothetical protein
MAEGLIDHESPRTAARGGLLGDLFRVYLRPEALFAELPAVNRAGPALWLLLALYVVQAALLLSTGVHAYEIERLTQRAMAREAERLPGDENADELTRKLEEMEKKAVFERLLNRLVLLVGGPLNVLLGVVTIAGLLYAVVALRGTAKADFGLLAGVAVFAAYTQVPRLLLQLYLVGELHASRVETSAAAFVSAPQTSLGVYLLLRRLDPFDTWYWLLIGLGVWKSGQLSAGRAVFATVVLALLSTLVLVSLDFQTVADMTQVWQAMQEEANK